MVSQIQCWSLGIETLNNEVFRNLTESKKLKRAKPFKSVKHWDHKKIAFFLEIEKEIAFYLVTPVIAFNFGAIAIKKAKGRKVRC